MKNLKKILTLSFLLSVCFAYTQSENIFASNSNSFLSIKKKYDNNIKGSLFVNKNFLPATINSMPQQYPTRYNAHTDNFEVEHNGSTKFIVPSKTSNYKVKFVYPSKLYQTFPYYTNSSDKVGFFVVKSSGNNYDFVVKEQIIYVEAEKPKTPYEKYKPARLKRVKDVYYLRVNKSEKLRKIKLKKKDVIKFFGKDSKKAASLIKKNRLNVKREKDMIELLKLYDNQ